jgi:hypothetical protein
VICPLTLPSIIKVNNFRISKFTGHLKAKWISNAPYEMEAFLLLLIMLSESLTSINET